jgi:small basic protein
MFKNVKNWKSTIAGIVAGVLVIAGVLYPEKFDPETHVAINAAVGEILSGIGALIAVISGLVAKD